MSALEDPYPESDPTHAHTHATRLIKEKLKSIHTHRHTCVGEKLPPLLKVFFLFDFQAEMLDKYCLVNTLNAIADILVKWRFTPSSG